MSEGVLWNASVEYKEITRPLLAIESLYVPITRYFSSIHLRPFHIHRDTFFKLSDMHMFKLSDMHMFLRCYLSKEENEDLYFKESEKASNRDWVSIQEHHLECSEDWTSIDTKDLYKSFDLDSVDSLWRVLLAHCPSETNKYKYVIVFICVHTICDGQSIIDFIVNQFIPLINEPKLIKKTC